MAAPPPGGMEFGRYRNTWSLNSLRGRFNHGLICPQQTGCLHFTFIRVCASPGRDRKKEEAKREKELEKESLHETEASSDVLPSDAVGGSRTKSSKRKLETATVTTHVTTVSFDQEASVAVPTTKRSRIETSPLESEEHSRDKEKEAGEVFTITTQYKEDYEILLKVRYVFLNFFTFRDFVCL